MQHRGEIVEKAVRTRISISEFARRLQVSRRTIYNWFGQDDLNFEIIKRSAIVLDNDFSSEFPNRLQKPAPTVQQDYYTQEYETGDAAFWKDKYIQLLAVHQRMVLGTKDFHRYELEALI